MVGLPRGVEQRGLDVLRLKEGVVAEDFLVRGASGEKREQVHHAKTSTADARASATFTGFDGDAIEWFHGGRLLRDGGFREHRFQFAHAVDDFFFQVREPGEDVARRTVRDFGVDDFLVAVEREVVALRGEVGPGHAEALRGARVLALGPVALRPAGEDVGQVVLRVVVGGERDLGHGAELFLGQQGRASVIQAPAVGLHVVEPDVIGAAGVGLGEEEDGGGDAGVGLEHAAGQGDDGIELLLLDEYPAQGLCGHWSCQTKPRQAR